MEKKVFFLREQVDTSAPAMLLLMGGKSRRMGQDKAWLLFEGRPFWERISGELSACGKVYLSVGKPLEGMPYPCIPDEILGGGVMGGLYSAFRAVPENLIFVCACDMPFMDAGFVRWLLDRWNAEEQKGNHWDGIVLCGEDGRAYPTAALYHRSLLPLLEKNLRENRLRMNTFVREEARMLLLPLAEAGGFSRCLRNINTPEEYRQLVADAFRPA